MVSAETNDRRSPHSRCFARGAFHQSNERFRVRPLGRLRQLVDERRYADRSRFGLIERHRLPLATWLESSTLSSGFAFSTAFRFSSLPRVSRLAIPCTSLLNVPDREGITVGQGILRLVEPFGLLRCA